MNAAVGAKFKSFGTEGIAAQCVLRQQLACSAWPAVCHYVYWVVTQQLWQSRESSSSEGLRLHRAC